MTPNQRVIEADWSASSEDEGAAFEIEEVSSNEGHKGEKKGAKEGNVGANSEGSVPPAPQEAKEPMDSRRVEFSRALEVGRVVHHYGDNLVLRSGDSILELGNQVFFADSPSGAFVRLGEVTDVFGEVNSPFYFVPVTVLLPGKLERGTPIFVDEKMGKFIGPSELESLKSVRATDAIFDIDQGLAVESSGSELEEEEDEMRLVEEFLRKRSPSQNFAKLK